MLPCAFTVSLWPSMRACDTRLTSITFCSIILPSLVVPLFFMPYFLLSFHVLEKTSTTCFLGTDKFHLLSYRTYFPKSSMIPFFLVVGRNPVVREWMNAMPLDIYSTFSVGKPPEWLYVLVFVSKCSHKKNRTVHPSLQRDDWLFRMCTQKCHGRIMWKIYSWLGQEASYSFP